MSIKRTSFALGSLLLALSPAHGQDAPDPGQLARIDALFEAWTTEVGPGGAYGVVREGRLVHAHGFGLADIEQRVAFDARTCSYVGSVAKQFTALAVLLLTEDGVLALDTDVREHVPELPDYGATIRISHLLHHTSGLRDHLVLAQWAGVRPVGDALTRDEAIALICRQRRLNFEPGDRFQYCNAGYMLLALVVERVSGRSFAEFAQERIFAAMGMDRSLVQDEPMSLIEGRAWGYRRLADGSFAHGTDRWYKVGPGGLFSSVEDLARWVGNFREPRVGTETLLAWMTEPPTFNDGSRGDEGAGLVPDSYRGVRVVHHAGNARGYGAEILRFPDHDLAVIVLCNVGRRVASPTRLALRVADVLLEEALDPLAPDAPATDVPAAEEQPPPGDVEIPDGPAPAIVSGVYAGSRRSSFFRVWEEQGSLRGAFGSGASFDLSPVAGDAVLITGSEETLIFLLSE
ncbi:MAG: serine hydrolase domain-containing protein, partial [Planctomycetota bacterium]